MKFFILFLIFSFSLSFTGNLTAETGDLSFMVGWSEKDITPDGPVFIAGQFHARVSEGVKTPLKATAMAVESVRPDGFSQHMVMVSCDIVSVSDCLRDSVRKLLSEELPEIDPMSVFLNATHTHAGPLVHIRERYVKDAPLREHPYGIPLPAMSPVEYLDFASRRIAEAVIEAWKAREPSGVSYGLGYAPVGRNRLISYKNGRSTMYGRTNVPEFSHIEGYQDHSVDILAVYRRAGELTGLVINFACPAQLDEGSWEISADYWHYVREELRRRLGENIFIFPQVSAAGDQSPHVRILRKAEERMWRLAGKNQFEFIASSISDTVEHVLSLINTEIDFEPYFAYRSEVIKLPRRIISEQDVEVNMRSAETHRARFEEMVKELEKNPALKEEPRWYRAISSTYRRSLRGQRVARRFHAQKENPNIGFEVHAFVIGDVAFVTNPFELYIDYGMQIKGRSPAIQTFIVQLAGPGSYVPTARSIEGGAYGAVPASTEIGVEGGYELVEWSVKTIEELISREN